VRRTWGSGAGIAHVCASILCRELGQQTAPALCARGACAACDACAACAACDLCAACGAGGADATPRAMGGRRICRRRQASGARPGGT